MRLGLGLFLVPPAFIANPALLRPDQDPVLASLAAIKIALGIGLLSYAVIGTGAERPAWPRLVAIAAGLCTIFALRLEYFWAEIVICRKGFRGYDARRAGLASGVARLP